MEDSSSRTWRPRNTHSKQRGLLWLSLQAKPASISHVKWKFVALVVSTISVYQARKKVLTFFGIFYYESQRGRNLFNTKIWSPSYLQSWLRCWTVFWGWGTQNDMCWWSKIRCHGSESEGPKSTYTLGWACDGPVMVKRVIVQGSLESLWVMGRTPDWGSEIWTLSITSSLWLCDFGQGT